MPQIRGAEAAADRRRQHQAVRHAARRADLPGGRASPATTRRSGGASSRPAKTPAAIVAKLNAEINKAIADPSVAERLREMGVSVAAQTPEQFGRFLAAETQKWSGVIKRAGIRAD